MLRTRQHRTQGLTPAQPCLQGLTPAQPCLTWEQCSVDLTAPPIPFGIIAALVPRWLINPLHWEPGDWIVGMDETRLDDAADFMIVGALDATMMRAPQTIAATEHFLRHGSFPDPQPVPVA